MRLRLAVLPGVYAVCRLEPAAAVPEWVPAAGFAPLAAADISVLLVATYDTDYLFVREDRLADALAALRAAGHHVSPA